MSANSNRCEHILLLRNGNFYQTIWRNNIAQLVRALRERIFPSWGFRLWNDRDSWAHCKNFVGARISMNEAEHHNSLKRPGVHVHYIRIHKRWTVDRWWCTVEKFFRWWRMKSKRSMIATRQLLSSSSRLLDAQYFPWPDFVCLRVNVV